MATVGEAENAAVEFQGYVNVDVVRRPVGSCFEVARGSEPEESAVEAKVQGEDAAVKFKKKIFSVAGNGANGLIFCGPSELCRFLRFDCDRVQDVYCANLLAPNQGA